MPLLWVFAAGCARTVNVRGPAMLPARIPVRAFPTIWVAGGHYEADAAVLERVVLHLSSTGKNKVHRVDPDQLEPMRLAGRIGPATVVMLVDLKVRESLRQSWDTTPVRVCGVFGCETRYQQVMNAVPEVRGELVVRIFEGPTARVLQRERIELTQQGTNPQTMRTQLVEGLAKRLESMLDVQRRWIDVELFRVKHPEAEKALAMVEAGDWDAGRKGLEDFVRSPNLKQLPEEQRARVFYDLGQARRFAPGSAGPSDETFDGAARAFREAVRLDPQTEYTFALRQLESHRRENARLLEQRRAAQHNFALGAKGGRVPQPPPSYQGSSPSAMGRQMTETDFEPD